MSRSMLKVLCFILALSSSLAFGQMGIFQSAPPPNQNPSAVAPLEDQKTQQIMQQQTDAQVKKQIQQYDATHPISTEGLSVPPPSPQPAPPVATPSTPASQSMSTTTTTTTGQNPVQPQSSQAPSTTQSPNTNNMPTPATSPPLPPSTEQYSVLPRTEPQQKSQGYTGFQGPAGTEDNNNNTNAPKPAPGWNIKY